MIVDRGATTRYRMLETIRQYAREKLIESGEAADLADRHLADLCGASGRVAEPIRGPAMVDWLDRIDAEADNLGAALEWGLEAAPWTAVRMCSALLGYWSVRVISEDDEDRIVAAIGLARAHVHGRPDADPAAQALAARLMGEAANIWGMSGRASEGLDWARDAVGLADLGGDAVAKRAAAVGLAVATAFSGGAGPDAVVPRRIFEEAIDLAERSGELWAVAIAAGFAGTSLSTFDPEAGAALLRRGVEAAHVSGSPYAIGAVTMAQGRALGRTGHTDEAVAAFDEAIRQFTELGDTRFTLAGRSDLAHALRRGGRLDEAMEMYRETIGGWVHLGQKGAIANQLENIAYVDVERGSSNRATCLLGAAAAIREASGSHMAYDEEPELARYLERLRAAMTPVAFEAALNAGRALPQADAVAYAFAEEPGPG